MTDLMFLLLLFLLIATTLINPNALRLSLPKSSNVLKEKAQTTVSIEQTATGYRYYVELEEMASLEAVDRQLYELLGNNEEATISLHCDKGVAIDEVVQVMNIASKRRYKLILATTSH